MRIFEVPVGGMDCAECSKHVQSAIESVPGVSSVTVFLAAEKAVISADPSRVDEDRIRAAIKSAGYTVPDAHVPEDQSSTEALGRRVKIAYGLIVAAVLAIAIFGEWMGILPPVLAAASQSIPDIAILTNSSRLLNQ